MGRMSKYAEWDNNASLSAAGLPRLQAGAELALERYWFQEASVDQWEYYEMQDYFKNFTDSKWLADREKIFKECDFDTDN